MSDAKTLLAREKAAVEACLESLLPAAGSWPARLVEALRYAVLGGGKRVRPVLARLACQAAGGDPAAMTPAACGLEYIHSYSLVHDDLPALDDDDLRRGRPTTHVAYDVPTAILVGDALLTEGLGLLATFPEGAGEIAGRRAEAVALVAGAAGLFGMVGGQIEDLEAGGQILDGEQPLSATERLERIHRHKTGCLIRASVELGALHAGLDEGSRAPYRAYGEALGLAFQVADDLLDATQSSEQLGKTAGKDEAQDKLTYVGLYGLDGTREKLAQLESGLVELARGLGSRELEILALYVTRRSS